MNQIDLLIYDTYKESAKMSDGVFESYLVLEVEVC
jgi:hypothetical protein